MVWQGGQRIGSATVALAVTDHIHSRCQRLLCYTKHVLRLARPFKSVHHDYGQRVRSILLPMTVAEHLDAGLHFDETLFRSGHMKASGDKKAGERLDVPAAQPAASYETRRLFFSLRIFGLRSSHTLILNRGQQFSAVE